VRRVIVIALLVVALIPHSAPDSLGGGVCEIEGTSGRDRLRGTPSNDVICGFRGRDHILGLGGHDWLRGGLDADVIIGGRGDDQLIGGNGRDRLRGKRGWDYLKGERDRDVHSGGPGPDCLNAVDGHLGDVLRGGPDDDYGSWDAGDRAVSTIRSEACPARPI
jgi:Ca2+-binding RTX toxin-like protein